MLPRLLFGCFSISFFALSGCSDPEPASLNKEQAYFDVPQFIAGEVAALEKIPVELRKTVGFGTEKPETRLLQNVDWNTELSFFREIDLNKKALAGNYTERKTALEDGNLLFYERISKANAPIKFLEIKTDKQNQVIHLKAVYEQENGLFFNREERALQTDGNQRLKAHSITGVQKVLLFDSIHYKVLSLLP